jgi:hypothetical protein
VDLIQRGKKEPINSMSELTSDKRYNSILKIIDEHLLPDIDAKKQRGEVFTPPELVREMLFGLKKSALDKGEFKIWGLDDTGNFVDDKESDRIGGIPTKIWQNPTSTFLDPANGIGNFPVIAFYKLDYELKKQPKFRDVNKRKKHIIEKMLYMIEIDKGNCQTCKSIFKKICPAATPNMCCKDTLSLTDIILKSQFGINRFDVIMGNPPFQLGGTKQSGKTIWNVFIIGDIRKKKEYIFPGSINLLNIDGYLTFVCPQGWRTPSYSEELDIMKSRDILLINILKSSHFEINFPVDYFLLKNNKYNLNTTIINESLQLYEKVNIKDLPFISNYAWDIFQKWIDNNIKMMDIKSTSTHNFSTKKDIFKPNKDAVFKYPIIKTLNSKGLDIGYSSLKHQDQDKIKVLIAFGSDLYPTIDNGIYGVSQNVYYILCNSLKDAKTIKTFLDNDKIKCIVNSLKISSYAVSNKLLSYLPDPTQFKYSLDKSLMLRPSTNKIFNICKLKQSSTRKRTGGSGNILFNKTRKNKK